MSENHNLNASIPPSLERSILDERHFEAISAFRSTMLAAADEINASGIPRLERAKFERAHKEALAELERAEREAEEYAERRANDPNKTRREKTIDGQHADAIGRRRETEGTEKEGNRTGGQGLRR